MTHNKDSLSPDAQLYANELARLQRAVLAIMQSGSPATDPRIAGRDLASVINNLVGGPPVAMLAVRDDTLRSRAGAVTARIFEPFGAGPKPILLFFHGGGWMVNDPAAYDSACRRLAALTECLVVSIDYRRAPEHPFPAALDDARIALSWAAEFGGDIGGDRSRLIVAGDSSGGNLAAALALWARDESGPAIAAQLLIYPPIDNRCDTPSFQEAAESGFLPPAVMRAFWAAYTPGGTIRETYAAPVWARSLTGLPPAYIVAAGHDPLHDEVIAYAERLRAAGVAVTCRDHSRQPHGFFFAAGVIHDALAANEAAASWIRDTVRRKEPDMTAGP